jgi:hypothetical protein
MKRLTQVPEGLRRAADQFKTLLDHYGPRAGIEGRGALGSQQTNAALQSVHGLRFWFGCGTPGLGSGHDHALRSTDKRGYSCSGGIVAGLLTRQRR